MNAGLNRDPLGGFFEDRVREGWMPGAVWIVTDPRGTISHGALGEAQREPHGEPMTESTVFDLASLTKPLVTGMLLALLEYEQLLDPLAPIEEYLEPLRGSIWGKERVVTFSTHATGLPDWHPLFLDSAEIEGYMSQIARLDRVNETGTVLYSDLGYIVLGALLERVGGESLDALFESRIARPLGLSMTGFFRSPVLRNGVAATERGNAFERAMALPRGGGFAWRTAIIRGEVHDANAWRLGGVAGHAGLFGTSREVEAIARHVIETDKPYGVTLRRRLFDEVENSGRTAGMVLAARSRAACGALPDDAPGHTGFTGTSLWFEPRRGRVYVLLTNRVHPVVPEQDFQPLRANFHRSARDLAKEGGPR